MTTHFFSTSDRSPFVFYSPEPASPPGTAKQSTMWFFWSWQAYPYPAIQLKDLYVQTKRAFEYGLSLESDREEFENPITVPSINEATGQKNVVPYVTAVNYPPIRDWKANLLADGTIDEEINENIRPTGNITNYFNLKDFNLQSEDHPIFVWIDQDPYEPTYIWGHFIVHD